MSAKTDQEFISFLHKELVDLMYERKISSDVMSVFHQIIGKWCMRKENHEKKDKEEEDA